MKSRLSLLVAAAALLLTGCESFSDATSSVRERIAAREQPRSKVFSGSPRLVFEAVKQAATNMGYRQTRGGPAQGEFDAVTAVGQGDRTGSSRQIAMKTRLRETLDGGSTEVTVSLTEILEDNSSSKMGMATQTPLRDTPQYEVFFRQIQQALDLRPSAAPVR